MRKHMTKISIYLEYLFLGISRKIAFEKLRPKNWKTIFSINFYNVPFGNKIGLNCHLSLLINEKDPKDDFK